jgi:hypothetical protein
MSIWTAIRRWWDNQDELDAIGVRYDILLDTWMTGLQKRVQLEFIISQAPMLDFPAEYERIVASTSPYAYINPETVRAASLPFKGSHLTKIGGSPTKWVFVDAIPVGQVIFSPNAMPGLEK